MQQALYQTRNINYTEIDKEIVELIRTLNKIPLTTTIESCAGHLRHRIVDPRYGTFIPDEGHKFLFDGYIFFNVDESHPKSQRFLSDTKELKKTYPFVSLEEQVYNFETCRELRLGHSDLTPVETVEREDTMQTVLKRVHQVETSVGRKRVKEYKSVWNDILSIAREHVE